MPRSAAVALLLLLPAVARADAGPIFPGERTVWKDFIFTIEQDYPDYDFYLLPLEDRFPAERLSLAPSNPVRVSGPGDNYRYKWANVYAVPKSALAEFGGSPPPRGWFQKNGTRAMRLELNGYYHDLAFRTSLLFTDTRSRVEITYRVEVGPDEWRLVQIAENAGNPWVKWGWIAAGVLVPVGLIGLGIWRIRRARRLRAMT